jgi:UDP-2,3-diacylglucosamine pyrophosphatase LpxH
MTKKVRSLFISDVHLGCRYSKAEELRSFLKGYEAEYLYLVGDIVDGWKLKKNFYWEDSYSFFLRKVLSMVKHGTKVYYAIGNHDEFLKHFAPHRFGNIALGDQFVHQTADGRRLLVIHGDYFDHLTKHFNWIYHLGDHAYSLALFVNRWMNAARRALGLSYWSFSAMLKGKVKKAVNYVNSFESFVARYTLQRGCTGVICGHIHWPAIKDIEGVQYYNCGDWIENCTALVELESGEIELVHWSDIASDIGEAVEPAPLEETSPTDAAALAMLAQAGGWSKRLQAG